MPNTEESIANNGIPEIEMEVELFQMVQTAVDKTLSVADMAADAKAVGDELDAIQMDIDQLMHETAEDIPVSATEGAQSIGSALAEINSTLETLESQSGADIPVNADAGAPSIAEMLTGLYPVGAIYMSGNAALPSVLTWLGTWEEIKIPATWNDLKNGTRSWATKGQTEATGNMHFWRRTA